MTPPRRALGPKNAHLAIAAVAAIVFLLPASAADAATNQISTVAGTGVAGYNGDNIAATTSQLKFPIDVAPTTDGGYLIADEQNFRIRKVLANGNITTAAGTGVSSDGGNGVATMTPIVFPLGVAVTSDGGFVIGDYNANKVRRVFPDGSMQTIAGTGLTVFNGDGIPGTAANLNKTPRVVQTADGGFLIVDQQNQRIRKLLPNGNIATVAGTGTAGYNGDNIPATGAQINTPEGVAALANGGFLIADTGNNRIRMVNPAGTITTIAGNGTAGSFGDGILATSANLNAPSDVAVAPDGQILIADTNSHLIRVIDTGGVIHTLAGVADMPGYTGDGGLATSAKLNTPFGVGVDAGGDVYIADHLNNVIRRVDADLAPPVPPDEPPSDPPPSDPPPSDQPPTVLCRGIQATIVGTDQGEVLRGTPQRDVIAALGGKDTAKGLGGSDLICGGDAADRLLGGGGKDVLNGEKGNDDLSGGPGNGDLCKGGKGVNDEATPTCERSPSVP